MEVPPYPHGSKIMKPQGAQAGGAFHTRPF